MRNGVAVVLCCHNSKEFIGATLDSIFSQTMPLDQLIIVDDGSMDDTILEVERCIGSVGRVIENIYFIQNACNLGTSMSANIALKSCSEKYVLFFSHDDINHRDRVKKTMEAFYDGAVMVCSNMDVPAQGGTIIVPSDASVLALAMVLSNVVPAPTVALDLNVTKQHKLFFNPQNDYAEDYDLWCRCILSGLDFRVLPDSLVSYTLHDRQTSVVKMVEQKMVADRIRLQYMRELFPFFTSAQIEPLVTLLLYQKDMIDKIDKKFLELLVSGMGRQDVVASVRSMYDYIRRILSDWTV